MSSSRDPPPPPAQGDEWPNIESANVAMRKELDLFANVRPVKVPEEGIDWTFFRENTEGAYTLGSKGVNVRRRSGGRLHRHHHSRAPSVLLELAYDYARKNHKDRVSIITKANVIKTTDGKFLKLCQEIGKEYPEITTDDWYIDITTAKLIDKKRRTDFQGIYSAQPLRRYHHRRSSRIPGRRRHRRQRKHRQALRHVRGHSRLGSPHGRRRAATNTPTPAPCSAPPLCCFPTSDSRSRPTCLTARSTFACMRKRSLTITGRDTGCTCSEFGDYVMETVKKLTK